MEGEIDLKEIIVVLWKGKYIIIFVTIAAMIVAAVASIFLVTPLYRTTAYIDLSNYGKEFELGPGMDEILRRPDKKLFIEDALADIAKDPKALAKLVELDESEDHEGYLEVIVLAPDPALAAEAANTVGFKLLRWSSENELEQLIEEKEDIEVRLDRQIEDSLENLDEELRSKKESLEKRIDSNKAYQAEMEKENGYEAEIERIGYILQDKWSNVTQVIEGFERGELPDIDLAVDTGSQTLIRHVQHIESLRERLDALSSEISAVKYNLARQIEVDYEAYFIAAEIPEQPSHIRLLLNTAVAGVLGLMLSVLVVFMRPYVNSLKAALKENDENK